MDAGGRTHTGRPDASSERRAWFDPHTIPIERMMREEAGPVKPRGQHYLVGHRLLPLSLFGDPGFLLRVGREQRLLALWEQAAHEMELLPVETRSEFDSTVVPSAGLQCSLEDIGLMTAAVVEMPAASRPTEVIYSVAVAPTRGHGLRGDRNERIRYFVLELVAPVNEWGVDPLAQTIEHLDKIKEAARATGDPDLIKQANALRDLPPQELIGSRELSRNEADVLTLRLMNILFTMFAEWTPQGRKSLGFGPPRFYEVGLPFLVGLTELGKVRFAILDHTRPLGSHDLWLPSFLNSLKREVPSVANLETRLAETPLASDFDQLKDASVRKRLFRSTFLQMVADQVSA